MMGKAEMTRREILSAAGRWFLGAGLASMSPVLFAGCESMGDMTAVGSSMAASAGLITQSQADSLNKSAYAVAKTFEDITPRQEYYIGRAIGATILTHYRPYSHQGVNRYINVLGQTLSQASDMPETYGGYHFQALDSDDINALSAPGGLIFITRGLLKCCRNEDAAAAVLAHEIGHVQFKHGLQAINKSRITDALNIIGAEGAKTFGGQELANLTAVFEDSISDISKTLINSGYSRSLEYDADKAAVTIMRRVGYDPNGLTEMLEQMKTRIKPGSADFAKTHPSPQNRLSEVQSVIGAYRPVNTTGPRQARFARELKDV
ncbi:MAG: M48 family metalloprotease [Desulfobacterales bacterium]|jgi:predicted Zn-dependent protease|nr:M48 family metalloprotease [Desulfobacterales bacterium]